MAKRDAAGSRPARVGERIRAELMELYARGQIKDPGARGLVVHEVLVSGDLRYAKIFVRLLEPDASGPRRTGLVAALDRAKGFLRRQLGDRLRLRYTPELTFLWDDTTERVSRIESVLEEIALEDAGREDPREGSSEGES